MTLRINRLDVYDVGDRIQVIHGSFAYWGTILWLSDSLFHIRWQPAGMNFRHEEFSIYSSLLTLL